MICIKKHQGFATEKYSNSPQTAPHYNKGMHTAALMMMMCGEVSTFDIFIPLLTIMTQSEVTSLNKKNSY